MCTKFFSDGDVHKYFNPYDTPYQAFINYMNVLSDFSGRLNDKLGEKASTDNLDEKQLKQMIETYEKNIEALKEKLNKKSKPKPIDKTKKLATPIEMQKPETKAIARSKKEATPIDKTKKNPLPIEKKKAEPKVIASTKKEAIPIEEKKRAKTTEKKKETKKAAEKTQDTKGKTSKKPVPKAKPVKKKEVGPKKK